MEPETENRAEIGSSNNLKPAKRTKPCFDPQNGKSCHQCRQKTLNFSADCKNHIKDKQCTLKYCRTCLLNRYGEKAEEVALLEDWSCPRCRGSCNCSRCMKGRGQQPTGMLVRKAKANGFSNVSDFLRIESPKEMGPTASVQQEVMVSTTNIDTEVDATDNEIQETTEVLVDTEQQNEIPLPLGSELTTVAGIELPPQEIGPALQFLEFCAAFGKILDVKKGHSEAILQELKNGTRRGQSSLVVEFQIQLLSLMQKDSGSPPLSSTDQKDSWLSALKKCIHDSDCSLDPSPLDLLDGVGGYDSLDSLMKLRLLIFLCDEVLKTEELRTWIREQNSKFAKETKEAKAKFVAAKHKEKLLQQELRDSVAKAVVEKNIAEHEAIVSEIKEKADQARAEMLDFESLDSKDGHISEAVRTEAVHLDSNGCVYWRLRGYSDNSEILGQEIGFGDELQPGAQEKWFSYDAEQTDLIEKKIKSLSTRDKRIRRKIQVQDMAFPTENKDVGLS